MILSKYNERYEKNPNLHRPLKIYHNFAYQPDMAQEEKQNIIYHTLLSLQEKGFGGIVTNVAFHNYMEDEQEWALYQYTIQACKQLGLRVWLYDEKGYPSGTAGGLTLAKNPAFEAQGVVMVYRIVAPHTTEIIPFPHGHTEILAAFAYEATTINQIDCQTPCHAYPDFVGTRQDVIIENTTNTTWFAACFIRKPLYEGTHAEHNVCESRRYVDVTNPQAIAEFISNTYGRYEKYSGQEFAQKHNGVIEAIFTDEPSFMGAYINAGLYPMSTHDPYDDTIELFPVINWGANVVNAFHSQKGYSILENLIYLFGSESAYAKQVRLDFQEVLSNLYEQSFFVQISNWCANAGLPFSGHVLLEDDIRHHVIFEGNFFSLLRHMHYPGIDMLHSLPELILRDAFTPKLVSSIAHTYNRPHVMSEVSAHAQGGKVTPEQMRCAVTLQYALGVDVFTSYYGEDALSVEEYQRWNNTIGHIDAIMGGGIHHAKVALYYPIETIQANYIPSNKQLFSEERFAGEDAINACADSVNQTLHTLLSEQLDFDFLDYTALEACKVKNGKFVSTGGEWFEILIIPNDEKTEKLQLLLNRFAEKGVKILSAKSLQNARLFIQPDMEAKTPLPEVVCLCRENENGKSILLVNTSNKSIFSEVCFNGFQAGMLYDPYLDCEQPTNICYNPNGAQTLPLTMQPYQTLLFVEK